MSPRRSTRRSDLLRRVPPGIVLVPEERKTEGIFKDLTTAANISLPVIGQASRFGMLRRRVERGLVERVTPAVDLAARYLPLGIASLSGGNQQKAVLARALITGARCLLLFDPTRGVDVGAKQSIYRMIQRFAAGGGAVLFYSTELDELMHLCDRCLVVYRNRVAGEVPRERLSQELILSIASGSALLLLLNGITSTSSKVIDEVTRSSCPLSAAWNSGVIKGSQSGAASMKYMKIAVSTPTGPDQDHPSIP
jgi:ABC-type sugar transport system ATPase subunit